MKSPIPSVSQSPQPHKFFEGFLDNDLELLSKELFDRYERIERAEIDGVTPVDVNDFFRDSNSVSTIKWRQYNVFQFHIDGVYNLYKGIASLAREACEHYDLDFEKEQFMIQGWFNINYSKSGKLNWHDHGPYGAPNFHGYYCVSAEPSSTYYQVFDKEVENINKNNRFILSEMGHPHAMGDWDWDGPRITIAYDLIPLRYLKEAGYSQEQHWIPLI
jgi:hypothetical protein